MIRRTPLRRVSKKHAKELRIYAKLRLDFLESHPMCEVGRKDICNRFSCDVHHVHGRGKHLNDKGTWLAVCRPCHDFIHRNPGQARQLGFLA